MMLLQIFQEALSNPSIYGYIGAGSGVGAALGSVITMGVQKLLNKNKEDVDITTVVNQQVRMLFDNGEFKDKIIKELQDWACYRERCKIRINGKEPEVIKKTPKKKMKKFSILFLLILALVGCKTQKQIIASVDRSETTFVREDVLYPILLKKDSARLQAIFECDSLNRVLMMELTESKTKGFESLFSFKDGVLNYELQSGGDTVFIPGTNIYYRTKINTTKTITNTKTIKVERELSGWQKFLIAWAKATFFIVLAVVMLFLIKLYFKIVLKRTVF